MPLSAGVCCALHKIVRYIGVRPPCAICEARQAALFISEHLSTNFPISAATSIIVVFHNSQEMVLLVISKMTSVIFRRMSQNHNNKWSKPSMSLTSSSYRKLCRGPGRMRSCGDWRLSEEKMSGKLGWVNQDPREQLRQRQEQKRQWIWQVKKGRHKSLVLLGEVLLPSSARMLWLYFWAYCANLAAQAAQASCCSSSRQKMLEKVYINFNFGHLCIW